MSEPAPCILKNQQNWTTRLDRRLNERRLMSLGRELNIRPLVCEDVDAVAHASTEAFLNLSDNDSLRLTRHPHLVAAVGDAAKKYGVGSGASRLITGTRDLHLQVEKRFAAFKGAEKSLIMATGFTANIATLATFPGEGDLVLMDKLSHASLIDGCRLARMNGATFRTFSHRQYDRAHDLLEEHQEQHQECDRYIITDTVFSMDGDLADLNALATLRDEFDGVLILDEAHATGVLGENGVGLDEHHLADITISTASKALGSFGGIVSGPAVAIDWLVNAARAFIFTTAVPPTQVAAINAALDVLESEPERRLRLQTNITRVRAALSEQGWKVTNDPTPIIPLIVGEPDDALALAAHLREYRILAPAIRPPTVAPGTSRVRLSLHSELSEGEIDHLLKALDAWPGRRGITT